MIMSGGGGSDRDDEDDGRGVTLLLVETSPLFQHSVHLYPVSFLWFGRVQTLYF